MVAVAMNLPPREVWEMDPIDLATVISVLQDQNRKRR
jgi:hypothetical protein